MSVRVEDRDRGYKKRIKKLREIGRPEVTVGIHESEASTTYEEGEATVLEVAVWNEFGTSRIPARSFLRAWFDENKTRAAEEWTRLMRAVGRGTLTKEQAVERFGLMCVGEIQARIADGVPPPNAESTVRQKGSSTPLINTGQLRSSITYQAKLG